MALLFDTLFDTSYKEHRARPKKRLSDKVCKLARPRKKGKGSTASMGSEPTRVEWFDVAELAAQTPVPEVLRRPPSEPFRLGSDFTGYGTDSLACHYLGVNYTVAFVAERSEVKDTLRRALEHHVTFKKPTVTYSDVRDRSAKDAPACDVFVTGPPCITFSSLGKRKGTLASQGRLMLHSLKYIVAQLPRVVIIENVRGLTFKRNAGLLNHVKDCLQALHYSVHIRVMCTSKSAVPQSRGRCYVVGIRGPKVPFKWPRDLPTVDLKHFLDQRLVKQEHSLNSRQHKLLLKLQEKHKGKLEKGWYCFDAGASWRFVSCLKDKCPCLTRTRACGHYLPRLRRFLTLAEHGSLQGLPGSLTLHMLEACQGDERAVRAALGDAMSLNVLMRVLGKALFSAGLLAQAPSDPWRQMAKDMSHCDLGSCSRRVLPDTYLQGNGPILK